MNITKVDIDKWQAAQQDELLVWKDSAGSDDWNKWWANHFDNYSFLNEFNIETVAEVGCGPYANNIQYVIGALETKPKSGMLNDPLLNEYIDAGKPVSTLINKKVMLNSCPLEELPTNHTYDCVICINVLSHVYDVTKCMTNIYNILNPNGIFIFGEDLTNDEDLISAPEILTDTMHPVRFTEEEIAKELEGYAAILDKTLSREEGRNPRAHYKTLIYSGQKV